ncbi:MAG TPA: hypothetical protein VFO14_09625 [Vicinamibacterales bacterium]|nr:hypothetical protein [Vicinamibacterales bacterium]
MEGHGQAAPEDLRYGARQDRRDHLLEFAEIARAAARAGAHLLLVPSCTDDRQGFLRVRYCAHARAIGNQI